MHTLETLKQRLKTTQDLHSVVTSMPAHMDALLQDSLPGNAVPLARLRASRLRQLR